MARKSITRSTSGLLDQLDDLKSQFGSNENRAVETILSRLSNLRIHDAKELVRLHELLLFVCAYPQSARARHLAESLLKGLDKRVQALHEGDVDLSPLESPEVSGIAGRSVTDTFTYPIVRWLVSRYSDRIELNWEWFEDENRLSETWPRFMPLLEEDAFVEANVPYATWLRAAKGSSVNDVAWLVRRFDSLTGTEREKAELFDSQNLYVSWTPPYPATRTGMRLTLPARSKVLRRVFYHREPLIQRRDLSFREALDTAAPALERLSTKEGEAVLDLARAASTIRYRELYGFTHGDPARVLRTHIGRGVDLFITGVSPGVRLPLRAYHAALIFKNGVPIGYFEGLSLFERMESGFNLYYTFREGETAWLYARTLNVFRHLLGVTAFAIDPYQIGYENEEGIDSGAFWFYRKLGFRPTNPDVLKLVVNEEKKIAARSNYRTSARTLRKLAAGPMIFELDQATSSDWDSFSVRNIGLAVARRMSSNFAGDAERFRQQAVAKLNEILGLTRGDWRATELPALRDFAVTLSLVVDLHNWSNTEKQALAGVVRAKVGPDESSYLNVMQNHARLRLAMIKLGSG